MRTARAELWVSDASAEPKEKRPLRVLDRHSSRTRNQLDNVNIYERKKVKTSAQHRVIECVYENAKLVGEVDDYCGSI